MITESNSKKIFKIVLWRVRPTEGVIPMKFVGLVSGGKDSIFSLAVCMSQDTNWSPWPTSIHLLQGGVAWWEWASGLYYDPTAGDEVEDLYELIKEVKARFHGVEGLASGAVLSTYQRTRVESVCARLGLTSLAYLWQRAQGDLLDEMLEFGMHAIVVKVASAGLRPSRHLGKSIEELLPTFKSLERRYQFHVAGEGGEYETLTLDCPLFKKRLVLDHTECVIESDDALAPVGHLHILQCHTEDKGTTPTYHTHQTAPFSFSGPLLRAPPVATPPPPPLPPPAPLPLLNVSLCRRGAQIFTSGIRGSDRDGDAAQQVSCCLSRLSAALAVHGLCLDDVVLVHLYLNDMATFGAVNSTYCQSFGDHPPSRSCIQAPLPPGCQVLLDAMAVAGSGAEMRQGNYTTRKVLHVRSISEWAPVCIGPYSQANTLTSHLHLLAGQIALLPPTMHMHAGGILQQLRVCMENVGAVLSSLQSSMHEALLVIAYVRMPTPQEHDTATPHHGSEPAWADVASAFEAACRAVPQGKKGEESSGEEDNGIDSDTDDQASLAAPPPLVLVGVPDLPRHAAIELEVVSLSRVLSRHLPAHRLTHTSLHPLPPLSSPSPLPQPFQPPLPLNMSIQNENENESPVGPRLSCTSQGSFLPYVLGLAQVTLSISCSEGSSHDALPLLDSDVLATTLKTEVDRLLCHCSLTRRQLMHVRGFYASTGPLTDSTLLEVLCLALGSTPKTLVPVSSLSGMAPLGSHVLLTLQLTALDLERLRTEAWVHAVPRPQL